MHELIAAGARRVVRVGSAGAMDPNLSPGAGVGHTKASLYAREFGSGPLGAVNTTYTQTLARSGAIASDMEASVLMILAAAASAGHAAPLSAGNAAVPVQAACVLGIYGGTDSHMDLDPAVCRQADERAIAVTLHGVMAWARADGILP